MNAIVKLNAVSAEGLARLITVIENDHNKLKVFGNKIKTIEREPEEVLSEYFRFVRIIEVKPDEKQTYLVTLKVHLEVWLGDERSWCGKDTFLSVFRSLKDGLLPSSDKQEALKVMMASLTALNGASLPYEICENNYGGGRVIVVANTRLTIEMLLHKIFPRLEFIELHGYQKGKDHQVDGIVDRLFRARDVARSLT